MISRRYRFVFIHQKKNGGCSVEAAFGIGDQFENPEAPWDRRHAPVVWYLEQAPDETRSFFRFTFVRNPWDREVSWYAMNLRDSLAKVRARLVAEDDAVRRKAEIRLKMLTDIQQDPDHRHFRNWCVSHSTLALRDQSRHIHPDLPFDVIGRFERFSEDFATICEQLGAKVSLPHKNASERGRYQNYFDDASRLSVAARYQDDIERFGYRF